MPRITFAANGASFEVPEGTQLLDFCQKNEVPIHFGCMAGVCGTCKIEILEGHDSLDPRSSDEQDTLEHIGDGPNCRLGCQLIVRQGNLTVHQPD